MRTKVVILFLLIFCSISIAQDANVPKNNLPPDMISELENRRDKTIANIQKCEGEIQKCNNTISKSENLVRLAQQKGNVKTEEIAKEALMKAQEAKKKNEETLEFYQFYKDLLDKKIDSLRQLTSNLSPSPNPPRDCKGLEEQLQRDKQAMKNYMKTIDMANKENEKWGKEAEEGRKLAMKTVLESVNLITKLVSIKLAKMSDKVSGIEREINKYLDMEEPAKKYYKNLLSGKFQRALDHYQEASRELSALKTAEATQIGTGINSASKSTAFYEATKNTIDLVKRYNELGNKEMMEILQDPEIKGLSLDLSSFLVEQSVSFAAMANESSGYLNKLDCIVKGAVLARDTLMTGAKYYYTSERLEQLGEVADIQLKATDALSKRMERTMERLKECREKVQKP